MPMGQEFQQIRTIIGPLESPEVSPGREWLLYLPSDSMEARLEAEAEGGAMAEARGMAGGTDQHINSISNVKRASVGSSQSSHE